MILTLRSTNVRQPEEIGERAGAPVLSAINKQPVAAESIAVGTEALEGDAVADPSVHGGPDKAIYAYPADHWAWWSAEVGLAPRPGAFGENLTVHGATEHDVNIGDQFSWGDVILQISQPRQPCFKFQMHTGKPDAAARMTTSGKCGWYFRVLQPGAAPTSGSIERIAVGAGASVFETFTAAFNPRYSRDTREQIAAEPALAPAWRAMLIGRA